MGAPHSYSATRAGGHTGSADRDSAGTIQHSNVEPHDRSCSLAELQRDISAMHIAMDNIRRHLPRPSDAAKLGAPQHIYEPTTDLFSGHPPNAAQLQARELLSQLQEKLRLFRLDLNLVVDPPHDIEISAGNNSGNSRILASRDSLVCSNIEFGLKSVTDRDEMTNVTGRMLTK